jgi:hypothetical protein
MKRQSNFQPLILGTLIGICCGLVATFYLLSGASTDPSRDSSIHESAALGSQTALGVQLSTIPQDARSNVDVNLRQHLDSAPEPVLPTLAPASLLGHWVSSKVFEEQLANEGIDGAWAPLMEQRIYEELAKVRLTFSGIQAHCRTTMCRIEVLIHDPLRTLETGVTARALIPAVETAMQHNMERWFIPVVMSFAMRYDGGGSLADLPTTPPHSRIWVAYVYDMSSMPSLIPENRRDAIRERILLELSE